MPQIRPITDLRNTSEISDACHARREPVFITKNGYGDLVVMSIETYEEMLDCIPVRLSVPCCRLGGRFGKAPPGGTSP